MRVNDRELAQISVGACDFDGILNHRTPHSGNFSQSGFKERYFKLKSNFLFYFRMSEMDKQPLGVLVLENSNVQFEVSTDIPFAFSIAFADDLDRKHLFSGRTESVCHEWVAMLKQATYSHWRSQLILLQTKINWKTGKDPLLIIPHNQGQVRNIQATHGSRGVVKYVGAKTTSFRSHLANAVQTASSQNPPQEKNLIEF